MDEHPEPTPFAAGQVVTVFRSRLRDDVGDEYPEMAAHMLELARSMPGFVDFKGFVAEDGERVSLATFADAGAQRAWREHVEHRLAQQAGRDRFYAAYSLQVAECTVAHGFVRDA